MLGRFIVIEGSEGAGKTTAIQTVVDVLKQYYITQLIFTREPGGTPLAESLRTLIKQDHQDEIITPEAELLLLYAARVQLVRNVIQPALKHGKWVIGDRHDLSTQAYQGGGRGLDSTLITSIKQSILGDFKPDFTLYLDLDPIIGLERAVKRGKLDRIEKESLTFFQYVRARYLALAKADNSIVIIDASQNIKQVAMSIEEHLTTWLHTIGK